MTLEFSCRDTGRGMSKEFQKHIFEPFQQEDSNAARTTYQGTGLGLVITKQLVQLMGGSIDFVRPGNHLYGEDSSENGRFGAG